jgi:hypothetical protein
MSRLIPGCLRVLFVVLTVTAIVILVSVVTRPVPLGVALNVDHSLRWSAVSGEMMGAWTDPASLAKPVAASAALPPELQSAIDRHLGSWSGSITPTPMGATIDNPAQWIAAVIDGRGLAIGEGRLAVQAWGHDGQDLIQAQAGTVVTTVDRVIVQRPGLHEIITTSTAGLRHDVVVEERPHGDGALVVEIGCQGGRFETKDANGAELVIHGRRMTYDRLKVSDTDGRELVARMEVVAGVVRVHVQDAGARYPLVVDPTVSATGSLGTGREFHTATLLLSGKVLVTGGGGLFGYDHYASCELYDPSTGAWVPTGSLATPRAEHTATLLPSGKVLVTGGFFDGTGHNSLASCELYDPDTGTWTTTGSLVTPRAEHTATLLPSGKVLVTGGYFDTHVIGPLASCELYDPDADTWAAAGSLATRRAGHTATVLSSGQVLVTGGSDAGSIEGLGSCELYDPSTGTWATTGSLITSRYYHAAVRLLSGKVLLTGGFSSAGNLTSCELYDPTAGTWAGTGSLTVARYSHPVILLPSGKVLVMGGSYNGGLLGSCELNDPTPGTWVEADALTAGRAHHTATLLASGKVLATVGIDAFSTLESCSLFDPGAGGSAVVACIIPTADPSWTTTLTALPVVGMADHPLGILAVTYQLSGATSGSGTATGTTAWTFTPTLNLGTTTITVTAEATDGSLATDTLNVTVTSPPTIAITLPTAGDSWLWASGGLTISGTATASGSATVTGVTYALSGATSGSGSATGTTSWTFLPVLSPGITTVTMTATDANGRTGRDTLTITRDVSNPVIVLSSPVVSGGTHMTATPHVRIAGTATDDGGIVGVNYSLYGATTASGTATGTAAWSFSPTLNHGITHVAILARDVANRTSVVTLDLLYPTTSEVGTTGTSGCGFGSGLGAMLFLVFLAVTGLRRQGSVG